MGEDDQQIVLAMPNVQFEALQMAERHLGLMLASSGIDEYRHWEGVGNTRKSYAVGGKNWVHVLSVLVVEYKKCLRSVATGKSQKTTDR